MRVQASSRNLIVGAGALFLIALVWQSSVSVLLALAAAALAWVTISRERTFRATAQRNAYLRANRTLAQILEFTPFAFEEFVGLLLELSGCTEVRHSGGTNDRGADLFCRDWQGQPAIVQCKRFAPHHPVRSPAIREFRGSMIFHQVARGIFVTTSRFTPEAVLQAGPHVLLIDGVALGQFVAHTVDNLE